MHPCNVLYCIVLHDSTRAQPRVLGGRVSRSGITNSQLLGICICRQGHIPPLPFPIIIIISISIAISIIMDSLIRPPWTLSRSSLPPLHHS